MNKKITLVAIGLSSVLLMGSLAMGTAFAATQGAYGSGGFGGRFGGTGMSAAAVGTVSSITGDTINVTDRNGTTYDVNATNATVTKDGASSSIGSINTGDTIIVQGTTSNGVVNATTIRDGVGGFNKMGSGVFGTVESNTGTTLTVTSKSGFGPNQTTGTTYTVDVGSATVTKDGASSSIGDVNVGDTVFVQGTVSGSTVNATTISDGVVPGRGGVGLKGHASSTPVITGNGEPVVGGTVTQVVGDIITITNKSNVTYTVDATSATVEKGGVSSSISNVAVGDNIIVQGTVSGNSVNASSVIDSGASVSSTTSNSGRNSGFMGRIGGAIGGFFHKLFGFF